MESEEKVVIGWMCIELMGKTVLAGLCEVANIAGCSFIRIDVPKVGDGGGFTKLIHPQSVFGMTPIDMELCRKMVETRRMRPFTVYPGEERGNSYDDQPF